MKQFFWKHLARFLAKPRIADALIRYAKRTPYMHLPSNEDPSYMERYWVFNPYDRATNKPRWGLLCPVSIRVHHIKREDLDRALHDHPWNARTIILRGWYEEKRLLIGDDRQGVIDRQTGLIKDLIKTFPGSHAEVFEYFTRRRGDTAALGFGEYHTITEVSEGGVYTLFFSSSWKGVWGFLVNGVKVPWREYLGIPAKGDLSDAVTPVEGFHTGGFVGSNHPRVSLLDGEIPAVFGSEWRQGATPDVMQHVTHTADGPVVDDVLYLSIPHLELCCCERCLAFKQKGDLRVPYPEGGLVLQPRGEVVAPACDSPFGCSSCNGTGKVFDERDRGPWTCYECNGTGEATGESGCATCNDTGGWGEGAQVQLCPDCNSKEQP